MKDFFSLREIQQEIASGRLSCRDLVEHYLHKITSRPQLNAFIEVFDEEARASAGQVDAKIQAGTQGRLAGLVIGIKDVICYQNHGLTASSRILSGFESVFTATALQRLLDEDAIVIGRQACDEFAMGSTSENSCYGPVRNPVDETRVPGGSSGGSASAVAAGLCHASLGSDTGGSVRQPASFCGVVGFKPSYGRISRWGLIAYASSFDQIGPITKSVEDAALLAEIMAGKDERDNTSSSQEVDPYSQGLEAPGNKKIAYLQEVIDSPGLDPEVKASLLDLIEKLRAAGHKVEAVSFPLLDYLVPCYYILTTGEASSNLSRYDGVRYGYRTAEANDLMTLYKKSRTEGFGDEVKRRILLGTFVLSAGYSDAYYTQAMKVRRMIQEATQAIFDQYDFLLSPTAPGPAFKLGELVDDPISMFLSDIFTVHANLSGNPAIAFPVEETADGLPIGMQLMGKMFGEQELLAMAKEVESSLR